MKALLLALVTLSAVAAQDSSARAKIKAEAARRAQLTPEQRAALWKAESEAFMKSAPGQVTTVQPILSPHTAVLIPATRPVAKPTPGVTDELAAGIKVGMDREEVLAKLGTPFSKLVSSDADRFTYRLISGGMFKLDFEDGQVRQIQNLSR